MVPVPAQMQLRDLPSVDHVLLELAHLESRFPRRVMLGEVRRVLDAVREEIRSGRNGNAEPIAAQVERSLARLEAPSLRRVINATGVVLHTNLGRAPLAWFDLLSGYSNLEYDLAAGR